jgi:hypothetical protein
MAVSKAAGDNTIVPALKGPRGADGTGNIP